jgi:autotransporter translocation and assembly factor TamB
MRPELSFREVTVHPRGLSRQVALSSGRILLSGRTVRIDDAQPIRGTFEEGSVALTGRVELSGLKPQRVKLRLQGQNVLFRVPAVMQLEVNPDVALTLDPNQGLKLAGEVVIADGRYIQKFDLKDLVFRPRISDNTPPPWKGIAALEAMLLELRVRSQSLAVKNNLGDIALGAEAVVQGTLAEPRLEGQLRVLSGTFRVPGLRGEYKLSGDSITFSPQDADIDPKFRVNPLVIIRARAPVEDSLQNKYDVSLETKGHLSQLEIKLTSIPTLEQGQIILLLTTGRTTDELRNLGVAQPRVSGVAGASDQAARELTAAWLREWVGDKLSDLTRLELRLELGTEAVKVQAGRRLGARARIWGDYERNYAGNWKRGAHAQLRLSDHLALEGELEQRLLLESALSDQQVLTNLRLQLKFRARVSP